VLLAVAAVEYWPLPARATHVLPTDAHRWLSRQPDSVAALDCVAPTPVDVQIPWLMQRRLGFLGGPVPTCADPLLGPKLAALGYTYVLRRERVDSPPLVGDPPVWLAQIARFGDSEVFEVLSPPPTVVSFEQQGFFLLEHDADDWWQWMGPEGRWRVRNTTSAVLDVTWTADVESAGWSRDVVIELDGQVVGGFTVGTSLTPLAVGPWPLWPGDHVVRFLATGDPFQPAVHTASTDSRALTIAWRRVTWLETHDD
jgi:hypothetical protein